MDGPETRDSYTPRLLRNDHNSLNFHHRKSPDEERRECAICDRQREESKAKKITSVFMVELEALPRLDELTRKLKDRKHGKGRLVKQIRRLRNSRRAIGQPKVVFLEEKAYAKISGLDRSKTKDRRPAK